MKTTENKGPNVIIESFPFNLDDQEKLERGQRLAAEIQQVYDARSALKQASADGKRSVEEHEKNVELLQSIVSTGVEWRDVNCEERLYRASGEVVVIRTDTGETVLIRPMHAQERQMKMTENGGTE